MSSQILKALKLARSCACTGICLSCIDIFRLICKNLKRNQRIPQQTLSEIVLLIAGITSFPDTVHDPSMTARSENDDVDCQLLFEELAECAQLRDCGWDWSLIAYSKSRRGQGPDLEGLQKYAKILCIILRHAPRGLPPLVSLRQVWSLLDQEHAIKPHDGVSRATWADDVGNRIRVMLKHLADVKNHRARGCPLVSRSLSVCCKPLLRALRLLLRCGVLLGHLLRPI